MYKPSHVQKTLSHCLNKIILDTQRRKPTFFLPSVKIKKRRTSVRYCGPIMSNQIPETLRIEENKNTFKRKLKNNKGFNFASYCTFKVTLLSAPVSSELPFCKTTLLRKQLISPILFGRSKIGKRGVVLHSLGNRKICKSQWFR